MKLRISDTTIIDLKDILVAEIEEQSIRVRFKNNFELVEFYNNDMEATCVFNNITSNLDMSDARFSKGERVTDEDARKEKAFEMFWNLYDKKVDVTRCKKSFMQLSLTEMGEAIKGVKEYVESTPNKRYRKNPTTWVNNKGWSSEVLLDKKKTNRYIAPKYISDER
tara:strand:- start:1985 stop:2482 length:498 start_codon:yes stop_codon:yes gene_type:complete